VPSPSFPALILFAHGSRDPEWAQPFRTIQRSIKAKRVGSAVELAFLEFMEPALADSVAALVREGHRSIVVAPLFMAQGGHLRRDLPKILEALRADNPGVAIGLLPAIGDCEPLLEAISDWVVSATAGQGVNQERK
jgi:sirohydrochlorin cobaltochelatase